MRLSESQTNDIIREWSEIGQRLGGVETLAKANVMRNMTDKAIGYAWGRMDEAITDSYRGVEAYTFGHAYGVHVGRALLDGHGTTTSLRDAWDTFVKDPLGRVYIPV